MERLPQKYSSVVEIILKALEGSDVPWVVTGSTSFALQGVLLEPRDIDIQTTALGAYIMEKILPGKVLIPVQERVSGRIRSNLGTKSVEGVDVEIMGAVQKRLFDGSWEPPVDILRLRTYVNWRGYRVPVLPLDYECDAYMKLGRYDRARQLREFIDARAKNADPA